MTTRDPQIRGWVNTTVTYLEMTTPATLPPVVLAHRIGVEVRQAIRPTASFFRYLYELIGEEWTWTGRRLMDDAALYDIIHDPLVEMNVLWVEGVPAGLAEFDRRSPPAIELSYFGLVPDFVGKGLGSFLLEWAIGHAWHSKPERFWVHTCDLDHPNALLVYQKAGFQIYKQDEVREIILQDMSPPKRLGQIIEVDNAP